jgi:hypothetical protein
MPQPGLTSNFTNSAATTNAKLLKGSAGVLYSISVMNASAAAKYLRIFNKATAPVPGTDTPVIVIEIPAGLSKEIEFGAFGKVFDTGIGLAITNAAAVLDNTAVAAGDVQAAVTYI